MSLSSRGSNLQRLNISMGCNIFLVIVRPGSDLEVQAETGWRTRSLGGDKVKELRGEGTKQSCIWILKTSELQQEKLYPLQKT